MRLLLDTQALIWTASSRERLGDAATVAIADGPAFVSVASLWEIAIKRGLRKLDLDDQFLAWVLASPLQLLLIEVRHVWRVADLPMIHRDPFDRLLVAQALEEDLTLVTSDPLMVHYGCDILRL